MQLSFNLPIISDNGKETTKEMKEVKNYLYRLTEQLRYILANLESDNFSGEFSDEIKAQVNNTAASLKSSYDRLLGELSGIRNSISALEGKELAVERGSAAVSAGADTEIAFSGFSDVPAVTVCYAQTAAEEEEFCPLAVHSVTKDGAKIAITGSTPASAQVCWLAIYQNN